MSLLLSGFVLLFLLTQQYGIFFRGVLVSSLGCVRRLGADSEVVRGSLKFLEVSMGQKLYLRENINLIKRAKKVMKKAISPFNHRQKQVKIITCSCT